MTNNRSSISSSTKNKSKFSVSPLIMLGLATGGLTETPVMSNKAPDISVKTGIISTIVYKKNEEEDCINVLDLFNRSYNYFSNNYFRTLTADLSKNQSEILEASKEVAYKQFMQKFTAETQKHSDYITISEISALTAFENSARKIASIPFEMSSIDLLPQDGYKFVLKLSGARILMASQYMVDSDISANTVVYSLFENRKLIESNALPVDDFVSYFTT